MATPPPVIRVISTSKAPAAIGPYSQAVLVNNTNMLYVSGQIGMMPSKTELVPGGARAETKQAMTNLSEILQAAGTSFKNVASLTILLADMSDFQAVIETYKGFFSDNTFPARNIYQVVGLPKNARVKIEAVAYVVEQGCC